MFTISNSSLSFIPTPSIHSNACLSIFGTLTPNNYAPLATLKASSNYSLLVKSLPAYTGDTAVLHLDNTNIRSVDVVEIAGIRYQVAFDPDNMKPGTFLFNTYTNTVTVKFPAFDHKEQSITTSSLKQAPPHARVNILATTGVPTDYVAPPYPSIFELLPLEGSFSWSLSWEGHPSGQFTFRTLASLKSACASLLAPGTEFVAWGIGFRINSVSIQEITASSQPLRIILVSVSLGGKHENYVDRVVPLRQLNNSELDAIPDCLNNLSLAQQEAIGLLRQTSVAELATRAGDRFIGPLMNIPIPNDTKESEGTTFLSKAQEQVRLSGCFLRFSNSIAVEAIPLNSVPQWFFQEQDLKSDVSCTLNARRKSNFLSLQAFHPKPKGQEIPATLLNPPTLHLRTEDQSIYQYVHTYEPAFKIDGAFIDYISISPIAKELTQNTAPIYLAPNYHRLPPVRKEIKEGDPSPSEPPENTGPIRDLSNLFSASGITKTYKVQVTLDDSPQSEHLERWGFAFLARDMYRGAGSNKILYGATSKWQKVEEKNTVYHYDRLTGYALGSTTTGWELIRFEEENLSGPNTLTLDEGNAEDRAQIKLYEYFKNPYIKEERTLLEPFAKYYRSPELPPTSSCKVLLPSGEYQIFNTSDPNYVEPYFVRESATFENNFKSIPDPRNTPDTPKPPRTTGKEALNRNSIVINNSNSTIFEGGQSPDSFNTYETQFSSSDARFSNSIQSTSFKRDYGRPPLAARRAPKYELIEPENQIGIPRPMQNNYIYFAYTELSSDRSSTSTISSQFYGGSLSYPAAKTLKEAQTAAYTEITIQNIKDVMQESFTIPFSPHIREGDRLTYVCNGEIRLRRVLSISHQVEVKGTVEGVPVITSKGSQVTVGLERDTPVKFKTEPIPKLATTRLGVFNTRPIGTIFQLNIETRRNFVS